MQNKIIVLLSLLVLGLSGYLFYNSLNSDEMSKAKIQTEFKDLKADYEFMQKDLEGISKSQIISSKVIEVQQKKIETLLRKSSITEEELVVAKKLMREISQSVLDEYQNRVASLEEEKLGLTTDQKKGEALLKELQSKLNEFQSKVINLENNNKVIAKKYDIEKKVSIKKDDLLAYASKLSISNFVLKSFKVRDSGKEIETDKASKIDRLKVFFDLNENKLAESGKKDLYIIAKSKDGTPMTFANKPAGSIDFDGKSIPFSDHITIDYKKGEEKTLELVWDSEEFKRGDYILEVYEKTDAGMIMIGKATKNLD